MMRAVKRCLVNKLIEISVSATPSWDQEVTHNYLALKNDPGKLRAAPEVPTHWLLLTTRYKTENWGRFEFIMHLVFITSLNRDLLHTPNIHKTLNCVRYTTVNVYYVGRTLKVSNT